VNTTARWIVAGLMLVCSFLAYLFARPASNSSDKPSINQSSNSLGSSIDFQDSLLRTVLGNQHKDIFKVTLPVQHFYNSKVDSNKLDSNKLDSNAVSLNSLHIQAVDTVTNAAIDSFIVSAGKRLPNGDSVSASFQAPEKVIDIGYYPAISTLQSSDIPQVFSPSSFSPYSIPITPLIELSKYAFVTTGTNALIGLGIGAEVTAMNTLTVAGEGILYPLTKPVIEARLLAKYLF